MTRVIAARFKLFPNYRHYGTQSSRQIRMNTCVGFAIGRWSDVLFDDNVSIDIYIIGLFDGQ